ncbi:GNAT family N-acetyltransferase [Arthrobacter sp. KBS0702]|uniref:GNAT family N-acetyltransferase n=1 Tax=Arthrobacter sp. KBS0702 TaxID=2578107 RepID=UPI00110EE585|nr:GNAT family N-acetyltransferase [Arthrobacter sp. KBS0702]QDW29900.1 GNAT family N-acetyltransferase [Arthrobacter sp. KBS0702]
MTLIARDSPARPDVRRLLDEHLADMFATSPAESVHALDHGALAGPDITFWTARGDGGVLLGCGALRDLGAGEGEIKSMRTARPARGRGVAALLLGRILDEAGQRGYRRLLLETGSQQFFDPARRLYARHGFVPCPPFAGYQPDPNSVFMARSLPDSLPG